MTSKKDFAAIRNYLLEPGYLFVAAEPTCISTVLGSCVSVCIYDRESKRGGMNHFRFPFTGDRTKATALYGNISTISLARMMISRGSNKESLEAQLFGGANNTEISHKDVGKENIRAARKALEKYDIRIVSEDVGGVLGRKVIFNTETGESAVIRVQRLRKEDWYPYESDR